MDFPSWADRRNRIKILILIVISSIFFTTQVCAGEVRVSQMADLTVLFDSSLGMPPGDVGGSYRAVKADLERIFGWQVSLRPTLLLIKESEEFQMMAGNPLIVAFAIPRKNLIVIDHSKMNIHPFSLETTLKHELCHLMLHERLGKANPPKWFEEGVCQWASDGIGEIIMDQKRSLLNRATLREAFIGLRELEDHFPNDKDSLLLAYEESKSFVAHIIREYGKAGLLRILNRMEKGEAAEVAVLNALSIPLKKLENEWQHSLRRKMNWFTYLSYHLYEVLFALMGLITIYAFIRIMWKKRVARMEDTEDAEPENKMNT